MNCKSCLAYPSIYKTTRQFCLRCLRDLFRLQDKLSSLEKSEEEMDKLEKQLAAIQEDLAKVESICEQEIAPDFETLEKQKTESKVNLA